ncbi:hypothetical protein BDR04DRAFT_1104759 [Suillus decipiens]|nr:hypothetical protein BDR04DRAFT_1104759 [Suillus decipiens]
MISWWSADSHIALISAASPAVAPVSTSSRDFCSIDQVSSTFSFLTSLLPKFLVLLLIVISVSLHSHHVQTLRVCAFDVCTVLFQNF